MTDYIPTGKIDWERLVKLKVSADTTLEALEGLKGNRIIQVHLMNYEREEYFVWDAADDTKVYIDHVRSLKNSSPRPGAIEIRLSNGTHLFGAGMEIDYLVKETA